MTINQLTELIRHIEEEHNFFNRKSGHRIVKSITPHIGLRSAGTVTAVEMQGYGWEKSFFKQKSRQGIAVSLFEIIMEFLDTPDE